MLTTVYIVPDCSSLRCILIYCNYHQGPQLYEELTGSFRCCPYPPTTFKSHLPKTESKLRRDG
jgi:hypothetical protein